MDWYLIHTKPRQEQVALENLQRQGFECYLPMLGIEKIRQGELVVCEEALFPRYLFIRLETGESARSWSPIRSTKGVSRLVTFGVDPARIDDRLVTALRARELLTRNSPHRLFAPGDRVCLTAGSFAGVEAVYQMADGEQRAMVLIELLSKPVAIRVAPASLRKVV